MSACRVSIAGNGRLVAYVDGGGVDVTVEVDLALQCQRNQSITSSYNTPKHERFREESPQCFVHSRHCRCCGRDRRYCVRSQRRGMRSMYGILA